MLLRGQLSIGKVAVASIVTAWTTLAICRIGFARNTKVPVLFV